MVTLESFFTPLYNAQTDKLLMKYSRDILRIEWRRYVWWLLGGSLYGILLYIKGSFWGWLFILFLAIFSTQYLLQTGPFGKDLLNYWRKGVLFINMIAISLFVVGYPSLVIATHPFYRGLNILGIYLLPAVTLLLLPPFWLRGKK
jgi:hypothetical protein